MMASSMSNPSNHNSRASRFANLEQVSTLKSPLQLGTGFGPSKNAWKSNIWADTGRINSFDGTVDGMNSTNLRSLSTNAESPLEGKTGSGSLLQSSESDGWNRGSGVPWPSSNINTSPTLHRTNDLDVSPVRQRTGDSQPFPMADLNDHSLPMSSNTNTRMPLGRGMVEQTPQNLRWNSISNPPQQEFEDQSLTGLGDLRVGERNGSISSRAAAFGTNTFMAPDHIQPFTNASNGSSMHNFNVFQPTSSSRTNIDMHQQPHFRPTTFPSKSSISRASVSRAIHRPFHPADSALDPSIHETGMRADDRDENLISELERLSLQANQQLSQKSGGSHRANSSWQMPYDPASDRPNLRIVSDDRFSSSQVLNLSNGMPERGFHHPSMYNRNGSFANGGSYSPGAGDGRRELVTPLTSATSTPPLDRGSGRGNSRSGSSSRASNGQAALLERRLQGLQGYLPEHQYYHSNPLHLRAQYPQHGEVNFPPQMQMNPLARPYPVPAYQTYSSVPPGPTHHGRYARNEIEPNQVIRSPLLEDFRTNSKTNKRFELKDIYGHVVEFSGDQYGSRFIQLKLETANSDEKEQVFGEIQPNAIQLMTDVFGNYVIQKLFEHGNQTQKKALANQMKGHVMTLSTQMYGCRVVQKALEHVLVDQQASIVKELDSHILKCVKDQNGNHVIQKAIERVPAQHIQFIIGAFRDQVQRLATHPYGCRVIQRMLEHCEIGARQSLLSELHACVPALITDQFGNYVIQHIIENGEETDRSSIISIVMSQLFTYSKHKFASNVVEKSIDCGEPGQRTEMLRLLSTPDEKGENPALILLRDQYGNYVIQKVLGHLKGHEREVLVRQIRIYLDHLKKSPYGKQVLAIEKQIYTTDHDCNPSPSTQSSSLPSTNTSTVEGPTGSLVSTKNNEGESSNKFDPPTTMKDNGKATTP